MFEEGEEILYTWNLHAHRYDKEAKKNMARKIPQTKPAKFISSNGGEWAVIEVVDPVGPKRMNVRLTSISKVVNA